MLPHIGRPAPGAGRGTCRRIVAPSLLHGAGLGLGRAMGGFVSTFFVASQALQLPATLAAALQGYAWAREGAGQSGAAVSRLQGKAGSPDLYLKHGTGNVADELAAEAGKLRWLAGRLPVPAVVQFVRAADQAWLLMTAMQGKTAGQVLESSPGAGPAVVDALAAFLRRVHALPVADCPFDSGHAVRLAHARARIAAGLVDVTDFDAEREGWTAGQVWQALQDHLPLAPDPVLTHGDCSLDNLLLHEGEVVGCIDVGRLGIADRYQDLAILHNCLGAFGAPLQQRLFRQYGIAHPDQARLRFHVLLDELF